MKKKLIELILEYGIIKTNFKQPITFKSGIKSPIYCNFRECSSHPDLRELIVESFKKLFPEEVDCIFGVPVGALPHSEIVAREMGLPSGYVRPDAKIKDHGLKKLIEGYEDISGKTVGLIEDLISTGGSIISNAQILQKHGASKIILASIFSYEMERSKKEFAEADLKLTSLITIYDILPFLKNSLPAEEYKSLEDWVNDPEGWFDRHKTEFEFGFLTQLRKSAEKAQSIICFGLDPVIEALPKGYEQYGIVGFCRFMKDVFAELKNNEISPGMFKPNLAWWQ
ncbi:MAG: phosphoribosyltransferase family protein, partial [Minisyncoccia bacterium]